MLRLEGGGGRIAEAVEVVGVKPPQDEDDILIASKQEDEEKSKYDHRGVKSGKKKVDFSCILAYYMTHKSLPARMDY